MISAVHGGLEVKAFILAFPGLWKGLTKSIHAHHYRNKDECVQRTLETAQSALIIIQSQRIGITALSLLSADFAQILRPYSITARGINVLSIVTGLVDLVIESRGILRCRTFYQTHTPPPSTYCSTKMKQNAVKEKLKALSSAYLHLNSQELLKIKKTMTKASSFRDFFKGYAYFEYLKQKTLQYKHFSLERCVGTHFAKELKTRIPLLIEKFDKKNAWFNHDNTLEEATTLLERVDRQAHKQVALHCLGIGIALLSILSGILLFTPLCPIAIGFAVGSLGLALYLFRSLAEEEFMRSEGWRFSLQNAFYRSFIQPIVSKLPSCLRPV